MAERRGRRRDDDDEDEDEGDDDEEPWNEAQWEAFMKESDVRAARFGELFETLIDDPDRDEKIADEMGWTREDEEETEEDRARREEFESIVAQAAQEVEEAAARGETFEDDEDDVHSIDAYAKSMAAAEAIFEIVKPWMNAPEEEEVDEEFGEAMIQSQIACAKIAGGHGMGYEDNVLCGNIVYNKIALDANRRSQESLGILRDRKLLPAVKVAQLLTMLREAETAIERRIAEMRAKVWW
jgi:hypothetical protein